MPTTKEETKERETGEDKKSELLLDSLEIKGYRCFEHLTIEKLGRVNLIVGKNNVGKTALLEALWIYSQRGRAETLVDLLVARDELPNPARFREINEDNKLLRESVWKIRNLFYGYPEVKSSFLETSFSIGLVNEDIGKLLVKIDWFDSTPVEERYESGSDIRLESTYLVEYEEYYGNSYPPNTNNYYPDTTESIPLQRLFKPRLNPPDYPRLSCLLVRATGIEKKDLYELWDAISLTNLEDDVSKALHIIEKKIKKVGFIGNPPGDESRIAVVQLENLTERIPLRSLGEGMNRLLGIALALVNCKDGMLLIDEIETGLHYSVLPDVWRLIFRTARELNVQVFATTHSYDCIQAFQKAAEEDKESDGMLIRLVRKNDKIRAVLFDEEEMETVVEQQIEVR